MDSTNLALEGIKKTLCSLPLRSSSENKTHTTYNTAAGESGCRIQVPLDEMPKSLHPGRLYPRSENSPQAEKAGDFRTPGC